MKIFISLSRADIWLQNVIQDKNYRGAPLGIFTSTIGQLKLEETVEMPTSLLLFKGQAKVIWEGH